MNKRFIKIVEGRISSLEESFRDNDFHEDYEMERLSLLRNFLREFNTIQKGFVDEESILNYLNEVLEHAKTHSPQIPNFGIDGIFTGSEFHDFQAAILACREQQAILLEVPSLIESMEE